MNYSHKAAVWVGLFVIAVAASLFVLAFRVSGGADFNKTEGYSVTAKFDNVGGLKVKSIVSIAGVPIGRVADIGFDPESFQAVVTMVIDGRYRQLPEDTSASILTSGLLGEQYIGLDPGGMDEYLADGDEIELTQSAIVLEKLIGKFLFDKAAE